MIRPVFAHLSRAERRAAPEPARASGETRRELVASKPDGRPTYATDEGLA